MFLLYKSPKNIDLAETSTLKNGLAETSVAETSVHHKRHYLANIHNGGVHKEPYVAYVHSGGVHKTTFRHCVHSGGVNILCLIS